MNVSVGINAKNKRTFIAQLERAKSVMPSKTWLHIDVSDPKFSSIKSYLDFGILKKYSSRFNFEAHLMVPGEKVCKYLKKPLKKIWVHVSAVKDWEVLFKEGKKSGIKIGVAIDISEIGFENKIPPEINSILVLAVTPGPSGQKFGTKAIKLIYFLRKKYPHATISVDGGINPAVAKKLKHLKIKNLVSTSFIWNSKNPLKAYRELKTI